MSPGVVDTGAHLGVGNMWVCLPKFVQAVRKSCVIIGKGQGGDMMKSMVTALPTTRMTNKMMMCVPVTRPPINIWTDGGPRSL